MRVAALGFPPLSRGARIFWFGVISAIGNLPATCPAAAQSHPLDALTAREITAVVGVVTADERFKDVRFQLITLAEPDKANVLSWKPGTPFVRHASVIAVRNTHVLEAEIDLAAKTILNIVDREGVEVATTVDESSSAVEVARADQRMIAALQLRGITDRDSVDCQPFTAGYFGITEHEGLRLMKIGCFDTSRSSNNIYGAPIERLYALVDLRAMKVIDVVDQGVVPTSQQDMNFTERDIKPLRRPEKPTLITQPKGRNFTIDGSMVKWGNWSFHVRFESRQGTVISLARWNDAGQNRSVLYQGYMSEMFVPYMDDDYGWYSRTYFDMGEYGIGQLASPLVPGIDCPIGAAFLGAVVNGAKGEPIVKPRTVCIFERNSGDPSWRHYEVNNGSFEGRPGVELVVRMASQVGNYDYLIDWVFNHAAELEARVGATGIVALKGVATKSMGDVTAATDTTYGTLVAPNAVAVQHDHYFNYRLDLDVDGPDNSFVTDTYQMVELPPTSPRRNVYRVIPEIADREGVVGVPAAHGDRHATVTKLRVINEQRFNAVGNRVGYEIIVGNHGLNLLEPSDWPGRRAAFLQGDVWVTPYTKQERYAAGEYVFASKGAQGLPVWTKQSRTVKNQDIVVWVNLAMQHLTRAEDIPVMPTVWHSFRLRPFNFFDRNPSVDLRRKFAN